MPIYQNFQIDSEIGLLVQIVYVQQSLYRYDNHKVIQFNLAKRRKEPAQFPGIFKKKNINLNFN